MSFDTGSIRFKVHLASSSQHLEEGEETSPARCFDYCAYRKTVGYGGFIKASFAIADSRTMHDVAPAQLAAMTAATMCRDELVKIPEDPKSDFRKAVNSLFSEIHSELTSQNHGRASRTTTSLTAGFFVKNKLFLGQVGTNRVYRYFRGDVIPVNPEGSQASITPRGDDFSTFIISRRLGNKEMPPVAYREIEILPGEILILCSDGLHSVFPMEKAGKILSMGKPLPKLSEKILSAAASIGLSDEASLILVQFGVYASSNRESEEDTGILDGREHKNNDQTSGEYEQDGETPKEYEKDGYPEEPADINADEEEVFEENEDSTKESYCEENDIPREKSEERSDMRKLYTVASGKERIFKAAAGLIALITLLLLGYLLGGDLISGKLYRGENRKAHLVITSTIPFQSLVYNNRELASHLRENRNKGAILLKSSTNNFSLEPAGVYSIELTFRKNVKVSIDTGKSQGAKLQSGLLKVTKTSSSQFSYHPLSGCRGVVVEGRNLEGPFEIDIAGFETMEIRFRQE